MKAIITIMLLLLLAACATVDQGAINKEIARRKQLTTAQRLELLERETLELEQRLGVTAGDAGAATGIAVGPMWY